VNCGGHVVTMQRGALVPRLICKALGPKSGRGSMTQYRANKYRARATMYNSVRYASKAEAAYAAELDLLLKAGQVVDWIAQPTVRLGVPENVYRPDFLVIWKEGESADRTLCSAVYVDIKGVETPKFRRDKKLWQAYGRLPLHIIRGGKTVEIIEPEGK